MSLTKDDIKTLQGMFQASEKRLEERLEIMIEVKLDEKLDQKFDERLAPIHQKLDYLEKRVDFSIDMINSVLLNHGPRIKNLEVEVGVIKSKTIGR